MTDPSCLCLRRSCESPAVVLIPDTGWRWARRARRAVAIGSLLAAVSVAAAGANLVLTNAGDLYGPAFTNGPAALPFRVQGQLLCVDQEWNQFYLFDGQHTHYLQPNGFRGTYKAADLVELNGVRLSRDGSLTNVFVRVLAHRALLPAKTIRLNAIRDAQNQWVATSGYVRSADLSRGRLALLLRFENQSCLATAMGGTPNVDCKDFIGTKVKLRGIVAETGGEVVRMMLPGPEEIVVLERAPIHPSAIEVTSIDALLSRSLGQWTNQMVRVTGSVVAAKPGESLTLKDPTGTLLVRVTQDTAVQPNERLDVWGYLSVLPDGAVLGDAYFEIIHPVVPSTTVATAGVTEAANPSQVLTNAYQVIHLDSARAAVGVPVRLEGVVTYADASYGNAFVQDASDAIYVQLTNAAVRAGDRVILTGRRETGQFAPIIVTEKVEVLGQSPLLQPAKVDVDDLADGHLDSHWVELEGVVRRVHTESGHAHLDCMSARGKFSAIIPGINSTPVHLIDSRVAVQGACGSQLNPRGQVSGITLHVPSLAQIQVTEASSPEPFSAAATPIGAVATFSPERLSGQRVKLSGTVTLLLPGQGFYLQDSSGGIRVHTEAADGLTPGDRVEVLGFPALGDYSPMLEEAVLHSIGSGTIPAPVPTTAAQILTYGTNDSLLVQTEAELLQAVPRSAQPKLLMRDGAITFTASLLGNASQASFSSLRPGSRLRFEGICSIQGSDVHEPQAFRLLLPNAGSVHLLWAPPNWTARHTMTVAAGVGMVMVCVMGWITMLRRQVRRQTEDIRKEKNLLAAFSTLGQRLSTAQSAKAAAQIIVEVADHLLGWDACTCHLYSARDQVLTHLLSQDLIEGRRAECTPTTATESPSPVMQRTISEGGQLILRDRPEAETSGLRPFGDEGRLAASLLFVPIRNGKTIIGALSIQSYRTNAYNRQSLETLQALADHCGGALDRIKTEEALQASERFVRSLVESLPQNILRKDLQGRFIFANKFYCRTVGRPMEQIIGKTDEDLYPPELAAKFRRDDQQVIRSGQLFATVEENLGPTGERNWVEVVKTPLYDTEGQPTGLQVIFWDVTPRKHAEAQLAYERDLLNALLDNLPEAIYFKDLQSRFVRVSRSKLESAFNMSRTRHKVANPNNGTPLPFHLANREAFSTYIIGKNDFDFFEQDRAREAFEDEQNILRTRKPMVGKLEHTVHADRRVTWCLSTKMPWYDPDGRLIGTFGISQDITSIKDAEAKLQEVHQRLVEASRQAGMADVATGVLHNVGNVLNSVNVSARLLTERVDESRVANLAKVSTLLEAHAHDLPLYLTQDPRGKQVPAYLQNLAKHLLDERAFLLDELNSLGGNIDHIKTIVAMQQSYAKVSGVAETVSPADLAEDALRINASALTRHHIEIVRDFRPDVPAITVDKHKVLQVLINVIRNAKYACDESAHPEKQIKISVFNGDGRVKICVADNGIGILPENMTRIFNLGFTTRTKGHGFGLHSGALAAKEMGGKLSANSEGRERGASFTLELPLSPPASN